LITAALLGFLQGIFEWLPVSSEGIVAAVYTLVEDGDFSEGVGYALWLHIGTVPAALIVFRREVVEVVKNLVASPTSPSPLTRFLVLSAAVSAVVGLPILIILTELSDLIGVAAMALIGALMLVTGLVQLRRKVAGSRSMDGLRWLDAALTGVAQGASALPGLSRSGLTVAALLTRDLDRKDALVLSFMMSIPASLGAALFAATDPGVELSRESIIAALIAFVTGLATIKLMLALARRINFGPFVIVIGTMMLAGSIGQLLS